MIELTISTAYPLWLTILWTGPETMRPWADMRPLPTLWWGGGGDFCGYSSWTSLVDWLDAFLERWSSIQPFLLGAALEGSIALGADADASPCYLESSSRLPHYGPLLASIHLWKKITKEIMKMDELEWTVRKISGRREKKKKKTYVDERKRLTIELQPSALNHHRKHGGYQAWLNPSTFSTQAELPKLAWGNSPTLRLFPDKLELKTKKQ